LLAPATEASLRERSLAKGNRVSITQEPFTRLPVKTTREEDLFEPLFSLRFAMLVFPPERLWVDKSRARASVVEGS
jgi:hypothetical protein